MIIKMGFFSYEMMFSLKMLSNLGGIQFRDLGVKV